jgi:DNA-binding transcriptional MerR regulator
MNRPDRRVRSKASPSAGEAFSSKEVACLAKVSLRQMQWLDERGVVSPYQQKHQRFYDPFEVLEIIVISELRRKRASLKQIRRILPLLKREVDGYLHKDRESRSELYLVTDMKEAHFEDKVEGVLDLFKKAKHPMLLVCISDHVRRLASEAESSYGKKQLRLRWLL